MDVLRNFSTNLSESFSPDITDDADKFDMMNIFDYCYGILHSSSYREKYKDLLSIDFPRVPVPKNSAMFRSIVRIGAHLRQLHLLEIPIENKLGIELMGDGDNTVSGFRFANGKAYINRTRYFSNVREDIWDFCFAGYHGLQKWLKDRRQQTLSETEIEHVINVFNVFDQTEADMVLLDTILEEYEVV